MGAGKRLTYYVEKQGFTKKEFCETFKLEYNSMVMIMAEKRPMGIKVINQMHDSLPKMNVHWLLYDEGPEEVAHEIGNYVNEAPGEYFVGFEAFKKQLIKALEDETIKEKIYEIIKKAS